MTPSHASPEPPPVSPPASPPVLPPASHVKEAKRHAIPRVFSDQRRLRIGILGGSFNPAHEGHAHIADMAVRLLALDALWWLVSPQNPLKSAADMAAFAVRYESACRAAASCRYRRKMVVSSLEQHLHGDFRGHFRGGTSAQSLKHIRRCCRHHRLVWIMGSDNMVSFHRWHQPGMIARAMAVAVVNRPGSVASALASPGSRIAGQRLAAKSLVARGLPPQHWTLLRGRMNTQSATAIRREHQTGA